MADFCTLADVEAKNPQRIYDANSKPTADEVTDFITLKSSELRAILNKHGIQESTLGPNALTLLRSICSMGAAYEAEQAGLMGRSPRLSDHAKDLRDDYNAWLEDLKEDPALLAEATAAAHVHSRATDITPKDAGTDPADEKWEPRFKMEDEW
jgi:hypothetical protein